MSKTITPNKLELVLKELATIKFEGGFKVPTEIPEQGCKNHYHLIGVRYSDAGVGKDKIKRGKHICIPINQYNRIQRQIKQKNLKQMFGGTWHSVYILHNPTLPMKEEKAAPKKLSPNIKGKVKKMYNDGIEAEEIAQVLDKDLKLVQEYINKLK